MADELGIAEALVYAELSFLQISLLDSLQDRLDEGLHVGDQAFDFYAHASHSHNRGVSWDRVLTYEGEIWIEEQLFVHLRLNENLSYREIANVLNSALGRRSSDEEYRTENSIAQKAIALGISRISKRGALQIDHPLYGDLKVAGNLQVDAVRTYMIDQFQKSDEEMAAFLEVTPRSFQSFLDRHDLPRPGQGRASPAGKTDTEASRLKSRHMAQEQALAEVMNYFLENDKQLPKTPRDRKQFSFSWQDFVGTSQTGRALFSKPEEAYIALDQYARRRGILIPMAQFTMLSPSETYERVVQQNVIDLVLEYLSKQAFGTVVSNKVLAQITGVAAEKIMGNGSYAEGKPSRAQAIFHSPSEFLLRLSQTAREQGLQILTVGQKTVRPSEALLASQKIEILQMYLSFYEKHSRFPLARDFKAGFEDELPISYSKVINSKASTHGRFESARELYLEIARFAKQTGQAFRWQDLPVLARPPHFRELIKEEVLSEFVRRIRAGESIPGHLDDEMWLNVFGVSRAYYLNIGISVSGEKAVYENGADFYVELNRRLAEFGLSYPVINIPYLSPTDDFIELRQAQVVERLIEYIVETESSELPSQNDFLDIFGFAKRRLYGHSAVSNEMAIFPSIEAAELTLAQAARIAGVPVPTIKANSGPKSE